jgi:hypothetical protein
LEGLAELGVRDELEKVVYFFGRVPGILDVEDVFLEVVFEDVETSSVGFRCF